ncbi:MAG: methyltransferase domain-containing protein, partial [Ilumatobacteraceae bacterium]
MARGDWDPGQYQRFAVERAQPFWDLTALVETDPPIERAVDLGCGAGDLTAQFAAQAGITEMTGVDSSPAMLERAVEHEREGVRFESGDIGTWEESAGFDLVFANASLHWVPDHPAVLARWASSLRPGGQLAVQVPCNSDHPSHLAAVGVATTEPFSSAMGGAPPPDPTAVNVLVPERYATV